VPLCSVTTSSLLQSWPACRAHGGTVRGLRSQSAWAAQRARSPVHGRGCWRREGARRREPAKPLPGPQRRRGGVGGPGDRCTVGRLWPGCDGACQPCPPRRRQQGAPPAASRVDRERVRGCPASRCGRALDGSLDAAPRPPRQPRESSHGGPLRSHAQDGATGVGSAAAAGHQGEALRSCTVMSRAPATVSSSSPPAPRAV